MTVRDRLGVMSKRISALLRLFRKRRRRRDDYALENLDDHLLDDLDITREQLNKALKR